MRITQDNISLSIDSSDFGLFPERVVLLYDSILRPRTTRYYTNITLLELYSGTRSPTELAKLSTTLQGNEELT